MVVIGFLLKKGEKAKGGKGEMEGDKKGKEED
jgi:hypothetical protein